MPITIQYMVAYPKFDCGIYSDHFHNDHNCTLDSKHNWTYKEKSPTCNTRKREINAGTEEIIILPVIFPLSYFIDLTFTLLKQEKISLCHQYRAMPTSKQSDQTLDCWISLKILQTVPKMECGLFHLRN